MIWAHDLFEQNLWTRGNQYIAGIDEVGRGAWAGPVVVGAVIFPAHIQLPFKLADSKLLTPKVRQKKAEQIKQTALSYAVIEVDVPTINQIGIGKAAQHAFLKSISALSLTPEHILIDAFKINNYPQKKQTPIIKGDQQSISIAAASIIAKVYRDLSMSQLLENDLYGFARHKGYGTKAHREAIARHGLSKHHRTSFNLQKWLTVSS